MRRSSALLALPVVFAFACSDQPTGPPDASALSPVFSAHASAAVWVAKVSGGFGGFENGTGDLIPLGQKNDINHIQINAKLFGDGSASGSLTGKRQLVNTAVPGLNTLLIFHIIKASVTCLEVDGNQAWIGGVVQKGALNAVLPLPPGTEAVFQVVLQPDGSVLVQLAPIPAALCTTKPDVPNKYRADNGNLTITDRR